MFKEFIDHQILEFPTLYFKNDYKKSEMMVLDHIFFVIGNGYEWKDGYPLMPSGNDELMVYSSVDIDKFFDMKDDIYMLDVNDDTREYIKKLDYEVSCLKDFSNSSYIYVNDKELVDKYNSAERVRKENDIMSRVDLFHRVNQFEKLVDDDRFVNYCSLYPISEFGYSMISEIKSQQMIQPETIEYALKFLNFAEEFYHNPKKFQKLPKGYRRMGFKSDIDSNEELKKIKILQEEIGKMI